MTRFSSQIVAATPGAPLDALALEDAWQVKRADIELTQTALSAHFNELDARYDFHNLSDNERANVPGIERYFDLEEWLDELREDANALLGLLAKAPCRTPAEASATLRVADALLAENAQDQNAAKLRRRVDQDACLWQAEPPRPSG